MKKQTRITANCLLIFFIFLIVSCDNKKDVLSPKVIPLASAVGNYSVLNLSEYATEIRYIPLETKDSVLIGVIRQIVYENERILILDYSSNCFLFDNNGKFLCKIGQMGQGPEDYISIGQVSIHENLIYLIGFDKMLIYDIDGHLVGTNNLLSDDISAEYDRMGSGMVVPLKKDTFVMNVCRMMGYYPKAILFETYQSGVKLIKEYQNYIKIDKLPPGIMSSDELGIMYSYKDEVRIFKIINDTVFSIGKSMEMKDAFIFDLGKYKPTLSFIEGKEARDNRFDYSKKFITLRNIFESNNYLFIDFNFGNHSPEPIERISSGGNPYTANYMYSVFNKFTGELILMKQHIKGKFGFKNDLDNGPVIWPHSVSSKNELVTYISVEEYLDYYDKIENPTLQMSEIAKNARMDDNQILIIAKLKE